MSTNKQVRLTPPASSKWLYGWMNYVAQWMGNGDNTTILNENEDFPKSEDWAEWEYVLSPSEEFLQKHNQWQMEKTASELSTLRDTSSQFRLRPYILSRATKAIDAASQVDKIDLLVSLDSGKRSKVIADVVKKYENEWRQWVKDMFFDEESMNWKKFDNFYSEQPYTKNTVGILREVAWQASHGQNGTLTNKVLADITWSIWNALRGSVRGALDRELTTEELKQIADEVCEIQAPLALLWAETVRNSKGGKAREGMLVTKWKVEEVERKKERKGRAVDGKWDPSPISIKPFERLHNPKEVRDILAKSLYFRVRKV